MLALLRLWTLVLGLLAKGRRQVSDGGKGSAPRPYSVDRETFANSWDRIFGKKPHPITVTVPADLPKALPEDTDDQAP